MIKEKNIDFCNIQRLEHFRLPILKNKQELMNVLGISIEEEKVFFYSKNRGEFLYKEKQIPKRSGGYRILEVPIDKLMYIQKAINRVILSRFAMVSSCTAYIKDRGIIDNATPHVGQKTVIKFDIVDFFGTITFKQIYFQFRFFGYGKEVSKYLTLLCVNSRNSLPQGAPTSPMLSNLVCKKLDKRILNYCKSIGLKYTRYADDITVSSSDALTNYKVNNIKSIIESIIRCEGFYPNEKKFTALKNGNRINITGLIVNDKLNVSKSIHREIENAIRYIGRYGIESHLEFIKCSKNNYKEHIFGLANFVRMVDNDKGNKYIIQLNNIFYPDLLKELE